MSTNDHENDKRDVKETKFNVIFGKEVVSGNEVGKTPQLLSELIDVCIKKISRKNEEINFKDDKYIQYVIPSLTHNTSYTYKELMETIGSSKCTNDIIIKLFPFSSLQITMKKQKAEEIISILQKQLNQVMGKFELLTKAISVPTVCVKDCQCSCVKVIKKLEEKIQEQSSKLMKQYEENKSLQKKMLDFNRKYLDMKFQMDKVKRNTDHVNAKKETANEKANLKQRNLELMEQNSANEETILQLENRNTQVHKHLNTFVSKYSNLVNFINGTLKEVNLCNMCNYKKAKSACSKCKSVFYCSRECQSKDWKSHKRKCNKSNKGDLKRFSEDAFATIGKYYLEDNSYELAKVNFMKALEINKNNFDVRVKLGTSFNKLGQYSDAHIEYTKAMKLNSNFEYLYYMMGKNYADSFKFERAMKWLNKSLEINPKYESSLIQLAQIHQSQKDFKKVVACYEKLIEINEGYRTSSQYLIACGELYIKQREFRKAIEVYLALSKSFPTEDFPRLMLGVAYFRLNCFESGIKHCKAAITLNPEQSKTHSTLGSIYLKQKKFKLAMGCFEMARKLSGMGFYGVYDLLALCNINSGNLDKAKQWCELSISTKKGFFAFNLYGIILLLKKNYAKAIKKLDIAIRCEKINEVEGYIYFNMGRAYYRSHKMMKAADCFKRAWEINKRQKEISRSDFVQYCCEGFVNRIVDKNEEEALKSFKKALLKDEKCYIEAVNFNFVRELRKMVGDKGK